MSGVLDIQFHFGMALYMQMEEEAARAAFQKFSKNRIQKYLRQKYGSPDGKVRIGSNVLLAYTLDEAEEAEKCLGILEIKRGTRRPELLAKLRARLNDVPDDPVALSRLAEAYEQRPGATKDPLVAKALGWVAYRERGYTRAVQFLTESGKERANDADLFFYLGMALYQLNRTSECADVLHKALALNVKHAQAEEANKVLASLSRK